MLIDLAINSLKRIKKQYLSITSKGRFRFFDVGFHGDRYLLELVDLIIQRCDYFVETGTGVGTTIAYVARTYPHIQCFSCEPDKEAFKHALRNTSSYQNVTLRNEPSQEFLKRFQSLQKIYHSDVLFWLDAHSHGFRWPLKEELEFITTHFERSFILIDDFKVPGLDCFGFDVYQDQICSFDYIQNSPNPDLSYRLYYPQYTQVTSQHHPLRGWGLIEYGHTDELDIPKSLRDKVRLVSTTWQQSTLLESSSITQQGRY